MPPPGPIDKAAFVKEKNNPKILEEYLDNFSPVYTLALRLSLVDQITSAK